MSITQAFARIPEATKQEALRWNRDCAINYDNDFHDYFVSPFVYRTITEDNQITVAQVVHGIITPIS